MDLWMGRGRFEGPPEPCISQQPKWREYIAPEGASAINMAPALQMIPLVSYLESDSGPVGESGVVVQGVAS